MIALSGIIKSIPAAVLLALAGTNQQSKGDSTMAETIMPCILLESNVGVRACNNDRLHRYACPKCGRERTLSSDQAKRHPLCRNCAASSHGRTHHPLFVVWTAMRTRCLNPNHDNYHNYGGRGITICDEWNNHGAGPFVDWALANGWRKGLQLDRIDNEGNYEPSNCHFVTPIQNARKKRTSVLTEGEVRAIRMLCWSGLPVKDVAMIMGTNLSNIYDIMKFRTWSDV